MSTTISNKKRLAFAFRPTKTIEEIAERIDVPVELVRAWFDYADAPRAKVPASNFGGY